MNLLEYKFKETDFTGRKISDLSDTPSSDGMSATDLKAYFDFVPKTMIALGAVNKIIDLLVSSSGGANIGTSITDVIGTNIEEILSSLKRLIDDRYTIETADSLLNTKADKTTVASMIKSISFDKSTGTFTITEQGGTVHSIDTMLEKLAVNFNYDEQREKLIITLDDGSIKEVDLSSLITQNEFLNSDTVNISVEGGKVTCDIVKGSITDEMLSTTLINTMIGYVNSCRASESSALSSAENSKNYADSALASASLATSKANLAEASASDAAEEANTARNEAITARSYAKGATGTRVGEETDNARYYKDKAELAMNEAIIARDEAREIAGGDFATKAELNEKENISKWTVGTLEAAKWTNGKYSFTKTYPSSSYDIEITPSNTCTENEILAYNAALITGNPAENIITALGEIPTVDIPIIIKFNEKNTARLLSISEEASENAPYTIVVENKTYSANNIVGSDSKLSEDNYSLDLL